MKVIKIVSVILVLLVTQSISAQYNYDVSYKGVFKPNKNDKSYVEEDVFLLSIRGNNSIYYSPKYQYMMSNQADAAKKNIDISRISSNYIITKEADKVTHHQAMLSSFMNYEDTELPKWKILKERKEIDSMKCQKAITHFRGRDYTAWFSEEIFIPEGPYKFKGLPGLIVELSSEDGDYHYSLVELKKNDQKIETIESIRLKDRKQYLKELNKIKENPSYQMQQEDQARQMKQKDYVNGKEVANLEKYKLFNEFVWEFMKKHNNPIETDDIWIR